MTQIITKGKMCLCGGVAQRTPPYPVYHPWRHLLPHTYEECNITYTVLFTEMLIQNVVLMKQTYKFRIHFVRQVSAIFIRVSVVKNRQTKGSGTVLAGKNWREPQRPHAWLAARWSSLPPTLSKDCERQIRDNRTHVNVDCMKDSTVELMWFVAVVAVGILHSHPSAPAAPVSSDAGPSVLHFI